LEALGGAGVADALVEADLALHYRVRLAGFPEALLDPAEHAALETLDDLGLLLGEVLEFERVRD